MGVLAGERPGYAILTVRVCVFVRSICMRASVCVRMSVYARVCIASLFMTTFKWLSAKNVDTWLVLPSVASALLIQFDSGQLCLSCVFGCGQLCAFHVCYIENA